MTSAGVMVILLLLLALFLFVYWVGVFIVLYHLIRFGIGTLPKKTALIFFIGSLVVSLGAIVFLFISYSSIDSLFVLSNQIQLQFMR